MQPARLVADQLACRRGDRVLLRDVGFALSAGEALHLSGANGIGKSSLLRILAGLARPFAGRVEATGTIALCDERLPLDAHRPLGAALRFWHAIDRAEPNLAPFGLETLAEVPVRYLSTGQRKRAALAMLAASGAAIWLLDEPLNGLDAEWSARVQRAIAAHCDAGGIAVIASHLALDLERLTVLPLGPHATD